jgi:hypothetical protein
MALTLGTAKITRTAAGQITLTYMNHGSFLLGEQLFGDHGKGWNAALRFCRERGLRVVEA